MQCNLDLASIAKLVHTYSTSMKDACNDKLTMCVTIAPCLKNSCANMVVTPWDLGSLVLLGGRGLLGPHGSCL